jgi:hypothetical protein
MGQFAHQFKDYEQYNDGDWYRKSVPANLPSTLAEVLAAACGADGESATATTMSSVANELLAIAGKKPTSNWDTGSLKAEIRSAYHILVESGFDKFMDATLNAAQRLCKAHPSAQTTLLDKINDTLLRANMGYTVRTVDGTDHLAWEARSEAVAGVALLNATGAAVADLSKEAFEHLEQAKTHLLNPASARSRKDAVRDAMSAMEAMVKKLAGENDYDDACKKLREEKVWGIDQIIKEAQSVWGFLHKHHPDVRHGQASGTDITIEEAIYWIDRVTAFVRYMASRRRLLGR